MGHVKDGEKVIRRTHEPPATMSSPKGDACSCGQPSNPAAARCTRCASKMCLHCHAAKDSHGYCPACQRKPADFREGPGKQEQESFPGSDYLPPSRNY